MDVSIHTVIFTPGRISHSRDYEHTPILQPSLLRISSNVLPLATDKGARFLAAGPSGTRAAYIERSRHMLGQSELALFSGPVRGLNALPHIDEHRQDQIAVPNYPVSRRVVLQGIASPMTRTATCLVFDEMFGTVCMSHANGITVFKFAPENIMLPTI